MQYTGSRYYGDFTNGRMEGECEFEFPPLLGTTYVGGIKDGLFHSDGTIIISDTLRFIGTFENCKETEGKYLFSDGLTFKPGEECDYCDCNKNRMFGVELRDGLKPAGYSLMANTVPLRDIPKGMYDCGDGFYQPEKRVVYTYDNQWLRATDEDEHKWIVEQCRKAEPDE